MQYKVPGTLGPSPTHIQIINTCAYFISMCGSDAKILYLLLGIFHRRKTHLCNLRKMNNVDTQGLPYDYDSLMHYSIGSFGNGQGPTLWPRDKSVNWWRLGQRIGLSILDALHLNIKYCPGQRSMLKINCKQGFFFRECCSIGWWNKCRRRTCGSILESSVGHYQ